MILPNDSQHARFESLGATLSSDAQVDLRTARQHRVVQRLVELSDAPPLRNKPAVTGRTVAWFVWLYVLAVAGTWLVLWHGGDQWWVATLMLFGPRWIYALPLVVLVPAALAMRRRLLWPLALSAVILAGPVMGFCVPWKTFGLAKEPTIRVVSWNVRGNCASSVVLAALIDETNPDIVALQECHADLSLEWPAGWHVHRQGRLVTGSRHPIGSVDSSQRRWPPSQWPPDNALRCVIDTPDHRIGFVNLHLGTPREGLSAVLSRRTLLSPSKSDALTESITCRRLESEELDGWIHQFSDPVVIAGDFNMPADGVIYRRMWSKYANAFSTAGLGFGHTKQTKVVGCQYGSRIDHILAAPGWRPCRSWVGPDLGSDHLPLIADLRWDGQ